MGKLLLLGLGVILLAIGWSEYTLLQTASVEPTVVELADLERGQVPSNRHLQIGTHWRVLDELIYTYEVPKNEKIGPNTKVNWVYYPIISEAHGYFASVGALRDKYASFENVPANERPPLKSFTVLVRSGRVDRVGALPGPQWDKAASLRGLVVTGAESLASDERGLLQQSFPALDLSQVLILQDGQSPQGLGYALSMLAAGACCGALALYLLLIKRKAKGLGDAPAIVDLSRSKP